MPSDAQRANAVREMVEAGIGEDWAAMIADEGSRFSAELVGDLMAVLASDGAPGSESLDRILAMDERTVRAALWSSSVMLASRQLDGLAAVSVTVIGL